MTALGATSCLQRLFPCGYGVIGQNVERTLYVGTPNSQVRLAFDIMVEANETTIAMIQPAIGLAEVDRTAKGVLTHYGYTTRSGSGCGRGIVSYEGNARELHMDLRLYSELLLEAGMAFSLEPDLLEVGVGTFRHCNTIIVTDEACVVDSCCRVGQSTFRKREATNVHRTCCADYPCPSTNGSS